LIEIRTHIIFISAGGSIPLKICSFRNHHQEIHYEKL
jgi:hypothetical protein